MKIKVDQDVLERKLLLLGFRESLSGTRYLRDAIMAWEPGMSMTKDLYPEVGKMHQTTAARAERAMRHAIETAFERANYDTVVGLFGYSLNPEKGCPTVSEFVARMARVCAVED